MNREVSLKMVSIEEQQRIRQTLTANKRLILGANGTEGDGCEWSIRLLKSGQYGLFITDEHGNRDLLNKLPDVLAVIYFLSSTDNPALSWEWI